MQKNRGQNHARNLGIQKSTAEIVTIMDSDDQDYGNDLTPIVEYFKNNQDISSVFGNQENYEKKRSDNYN